MQYTGPLENLTEFYSEYPFCVQFITFEDCNSQDVFLKTEAEAVSLASQLKLYGYSVIREAFVFGKWISVDDD